ncbi:MAG: MarR family transcriptional regulator [Terricaulis sp.]
MSGRAPFLNEEEPPFDLRVSPSHLLHRVEQLANDRFAQLVNDAVTLRQFTVLAAAAAAPNCAQRDLARSTGIDRSTLSDLLARLEKRGLIARAASTRDARSVVIRTTPAGDAALRQATKHARAADAAILDALPRTKRRNFVNILIKLARMSEEMAERVEREARRKAKTERRTRRKNKTFSTASKPIPR